MTDTYTVLARKYRPETFADLVGQDAMVRTLRNAFDAGRIAQAFILTGIRGTGKTTTARIVAKGMNCIGPDGTGGPTTAPCGTCEHCTAIMQGRHVDVIEMDAASRTGVADIRDIIDSVHYRAASARYKIYIIDEVHMLSINAFNALLKTLEEPPEHVKFIFATTEIRKVPVTVLSRCQRFDLRRIEPDVMAGLLRKIADGEGASITDDALALIIRAAEGSARDATSLLDQAISHGAGETNAEQVRDMLGLADRGLILDLLDHLLNGDAAAALQSISAQYAEGADPLAILRDLAELTHWLSVIKITPQAADDPTVSPDERSRGVEMAKALPMRILARLWQMLLKAIEEVSLAPNAMMAAEMAVIRITHIADLPTPEALIEQIQTNDEDDPPPPPSGGGGVRGAGVPTRRHRHTLRHARAGMGNNRPSTHGSLALALSAEDQLAHLTQFDHVLAVIEEQRDTKLLVDIERGVHLIDYRPGVIEFRPASEAPADLIPRWQRLLQFKTGAPWRFVLHNDGGAPTLFQKAQAQAQKEEAEIKKEPVVEAVLRHFPNAKISTIAPRGELNAHVLEESLEEFDEDWDPFSDE